MSSLLWNTRNKSKTNQHRTRRRFVSVLFLFAVVVCLFVSSKLNHRIQLESSALTVAAAVKKQEGTAETKTVPSLIKKTFRNSSSSGIAWSVWNRTEPIRNYPQALECDWQTYRTEWGLETPICVHQGYDIVSGSIRRKGRWEDCDILTKLWMELPNNNKHAVYVDVGANIGACVVQMLLTTNATILAFEPHPKNQFCLTSTLMKMDKKLSDRVWLFPLGLGKDHEGTSTIHAARGNMGNSIVGGKVIKDKPRQAFDVSVPIALERLDDVLDASQLLDNHGGWSIPLLKMDAQGYECYILEGMPRLLNKISTIKAELAEKWLSGFEGCSGEILLDQLKKADFDWGQPTKEGLAKEILARSKQHHNTS